MNCHTLSFLFCFFFCSLLSAQEASLAGLDMAKEPTTAPADLALLARKHNRLAVRQITDHLAARISYPEAMAEYSLEGMLTLKLTIDKAGKITNIGLVTTELPETFTETAIEIMRALKRIELNGDLYYGNNTFKVPFHFSL